VSAQERQDFAVPVAVGAWDGIELALLARDDEDDRRILIEAEHPELHRALRTGADEVHLAGTTINPRLHIVMHEIVANQLWADDPPEMWETAQRLTAAGYDRHEVLHMLASVNSQTVYHVLRDRVPADIDRMRAALADLPGSWERERTAGSGEHRPNRAERRATRRPRH
jgi:Domain of unknown function (DUF1841)